MPFPPYVNSIIITFAQCLLFSVLCGFRIFPPESKPARNDGSGLGGYNLKFLFLMYGIGLVLFLLLALVGEVFLNQREDGLTSADRILAISLLTDLSLLAAFYFVYEGLVPFEWLGRGRIRYRSNSAWWASRVIPVGFGVTVATALIALTGGSSGGCNARTAQ